MNLNKIINDVINIKQVLIKNLICICGSKDLLHLNAYHSFDIYLCNKCNKQLKKLTK